MPKSTTESPVIIDRDDDDVVTLTMSRSKLNLMDLEMLEQLRTGLADNVAANARAIVLTGANACFSAGLDTRALASYDESQRRQTVELLNAFVRELYGAPVPTVAAVTGHALAGGLIFALACDRRYVVGDQCKLGLPEVQAGVPFPAIPLLVTRAELSPTQLRMLALTGEALTPQLAVQHGIFDLETAATGLLDKARAEAKTLAAHPAYSRVKNQLREAVCTQADEIIKSESDPMLRSWL